GQRSGGPPDMVRGPGSVRSEVEEGVAVEIAEAGVGEKDLGLVPGKGDALAAARHRDVVGVLEAGEHQQVLTGVEVEDGVAAGAAAEDEAVGALVAAQQVVT